MIFEIPCWSNRLLMMFFDELFIPLWHCTMMLEIPCLSNRILLMIFEELFIPFWHGTMMMEIPRWSNRLLLMFFMGSSFPCDTVQWCSKYLVGLIVYYLFFDELFIPLWHGPMLFEIPCFSNCLLVIVLMNSSSPSDTVQWCSKHLVGLIVFYWWLFYKLFNLLWHVTMMIEIPCFSYHQLFIIFYELCIPFWLVIMIFEIPCLSYRLLLMIFD
jgi:hypothetical protein